MGILKDWLYESQADSLRNGSNVLTKGTAIGVNELQALLREATEGENSMTAHNSGLSDASTGLDEGRQAVIRFKTITQAEKGRGKKPGER